MERIVLFVMLLSIVSSPVQAQDMDVSEPVLAFAGVDSPEEMDPEEFERLSDYLAAPLRLNSVSESELASSGLLSAYQMASLRDYRNRHGNVMSYLELAAVDGFGDAFVRLLRPFISLESPQMFENKPAVRNEAALRTACRHSGGPDWNYGLKYRLKTGRMTLSMAVDKGYGTATSAPSACSASLSWDWSRGRLALGDFNARFGQGLALWNSSFITSLSAPEAFMRKPSGISGVYSYTGSSALTGIAGEIRFGGTSVSLMGAVPGLRQIRSHPDRLRLMPAVNVAWRGRHGQMSLTHLMEMSGILVHSEDFRIPVMRTSADAAFCVMGVNVFGELMYDWVAAKLHLLSGVDLRLGESGRLACLLRYFPSKGNASASLHGAALSSAFTPAGGHSCVFSVDAVRYPEPKQQGVRHSIQVKALADWRFLAGEHLELKLRLSERIRTWGLRFRTDLRADVSYTQGPLIFNARANLLNCVGLGLAGYLEQGYKTQDLSVYLREGFFKVDDWDDRIYVYERDAPGTFNVPALYGRGWFASLVGAVRAAGWVKIYARIAYTGYHFMPREKRKPGKAELKVQAVFRF